MNHLNDVFKLCWSQWNVPWILELAPPFGLYLCLQGKGYCIVLNENAYSLSVIHFYLKIWNLPTSQTKFIFLGGSGTTVAYSRTSTSLQWPPLFYGSNKVLTLEMAASQSLYGDQFTLSSQLIKLHYLYMGTGFGPSQ